MGVRISLFPATLIVGSTQGWNSPSESPDRTPVKKNEWEENQGNKILSCITVGIDEKHTTKPYNKFTGIIHMLSSVVN